MENFLHYTVSRSLGKGKHGDTFLAMDSGLQRPVVIKRLKRGIRIDADKEKFLQRMKLLSSLDDRRITLFYGLEEDNHRQYIIREYVEGYPLTHIARRPLPFQQVMSYGLQIATVLALMHDRQIWHLNLTPNNILCPEMSGVTVTDFCLDMFESDITQPPQQPDSIYLAPEQLRGEAVGFEADCWALGMILLRLTTGPVENRPSDAESGLAWIQSGEPMAEVDNLHAVPEDGRLLLKKMIALDPIDRFVTSAELVATIRAVAFGATDSPQSSSAAAMAEGAPPPHIDKSRRYLLLAVLMALLVILWLVVTTIDQ